jgi:hypothetical protein
MRLGIPMYINADDAPNGVGIGGPTGQRIQTRASVIALWERARADLEAAGAEVVEVDFPAVSNYEGDRPGAPTIANRGLVSPEYLRREIVDLSAWAWEDFLAANGDPAFHTLTGVDGARIFRSRTALCPTATRASRTTSPTTPTGCARTRRPIRGGPCPNCPTASAASETRRIDLEEWMDDLGLDAVVFPAVADVGEATMDADEDAAARGWRNGVWVANGNLAIRHLGIPTVTVPLGTMDDIGMPVGLTFAGRAYDDGAACTGAAFEALAPRREPPRTPALPTRRRLPKVTHDDPPERDAHARRHRRDPRHRGPGPRLLARPAAVGGHPLDKPLPPAELTRLAGRTIDEHGIGAAKALGIFQHVLAPACITTDDPRYLSFIPSAPTKAAAAFDLVVSASALYGGSWLEGAGAVHAENEVLRWLAAEFGLPPAPARVRPGRDARQSLRPRRGAGRARSARGGGRAVPTAGGSSAASKRTRRSPRRRGSWTSSRRCARRRRRHPPR